MDAEKTAVSANLDVFPVAAVSFVITHSAVIYSGFFHLVSCMCPFKQNSPILQDRSHDDKYTCILWRNNSVGELQT